MATILLNEALQRGLRPEPEIRENAPYLLSADNVRATVQGLQGFKLLQNPFTGQTYTDKSITPGSGFPQLFRGKAVSLLCDQQAIYSTNEDLITDSQLEVGWDLTELTIYDWSTYNFGTDAATVTTIPANGDRWVMMDFHTTWMLLNGKCIVFKVPFSAKVFMVDEVTINTGCVLKDTRPFFGGFDPTDTYSLVDWPSILANAQSEVPDSIDNLLSAGGMGKNWVWYGSMAGGDLLWLFTDMLLKYNTTAGEEAFDDDYRFYFDLWKQNQSGAVVLPFQGEIVALRATQEAVVAFGDDGVAGMVPYQQPEAVMGLRDIGGLPHGVGIAGRTAWAGDHRDTVFVDQSGCAWYVSIDLQAERLGHQEWLSPLLDAGLWVEFDPHNKEYYLGNADTAYLLSQTGFTKAPWMPFSLSFAQGGVLTPRDLVNPSKTHVKTANYTVEQPRGIREIRMVQCFAKNCEAIEARVNYQINLAGTWKQTAWLPLDARGVATMNVSCSRFRIELRWDYAANQLLDGLQVMFSDSTLLEIKDTFNV